MNKSRSVFIMVGPGIAKILVVTLFISKSTSPFNHRWFILASCQVKFQRCEWLSAESNDSPSSFPSTGLTVFVHYRHAYGQCMVQSFSACRVHVIRYPGSWRRASLHWPPSKFALSFFLSVSVSGLSLLQHFACKTHAVGFILVEWSECSADYS